MVCILFLLDSTGPGTPRTDNSTVKDLAEETERTEIWKTNQTQMALALPSVWLLSWQRRSGTELPSSPNLGLPFTGRGDARSGALSNDVICKPGWLLKPTQSTSGWYSLGTIHSAWDHGTFFAGGNSTVSRGQVIVMLNNLHWQETHLHICSLNGFLLIFPKNRERTAGLHTQCKVLWVH